MNGAINYTISRKMKNILNKLFLETTQSTLLQLFRYGFVGGVASVADYGTLYLFTEAFHIYHLLSAAIAFVIGLIVNYLLSTSWVFASRTQKNKWIEFAIFAIIGLFGLGWNEIIIYVGTDVCELHYMISKLISTVIVFFWNFFARKIILFKNL